MEPKTDITNNTSKTKKRKKLARKNILRMLYLGLFLLLTTCVVAGTQIFMRNLEDFSEYASSYTGFIADNMETSQVPKYLETREKDEYYLDIEWAFLTANRSGMFREIYLIVPEEDGVTYIADTYFPDIDLAADEYFTIQQENQADFLETRPYAEGEKESLMKLMADQTMNSHYMGLNTKKGEIVASSASPLLYVHDDTVSVVGILGMDISMDDIWRAIVRMALNLFCAVAIILVIGIIVYYYFLKRSMIDPVVKLNKATKELVANLGSDHPFEVDIHTNDELEDLSDSFEEMSQNLKRYINENAAITAEKERLSTELDLARRIQTDMLPNHFPPFPDRMEFDIFASMNPAKEVGGDFYDFFLVEDQLGLVMADVSGKGIPAALFMMMAKIMVQNLARTGLSPKEVLERVNNQICEMSSEEMFVTVWLGVLDLNTGVLKAANAGHEYPILKEPDGAFEIVKDKHGLVVGGMEGISYKEYELLLKPGSKLFLYTDGLPEATNAENEMFGTARVVDVLNEVQDQGPEEILKHAKAQSDAFVGEAPQFDDLTMMCIEYHGKE